MILRHLDRNRYKVTQESRTAECPSARADSSKNLGLIADADLMQFDPRAENSRQLADQFPEINPAFRTEMESQTTAIESVFRFDQLHLQFQLLHFRLAHGKGFFRLCAIFFILLEVLFGRNADDVFMRKDAAFFIAFFIDNDDLANIDSIPIIYDQFFVHSVLCLACFIIRDGPDRHKTNTNYVFHFLSPPEALSIGYSRARFLPVPLGVEHLLPDVSFH